MHYLEIYVNAISSSYQEHGEKLRQAQRRADDILGTLDSAASSAVSLQSSVLGTFGFRGWWPYIYCPMVSLVMGSYGLPPSATRNIVLVGLGEVAGYLVSNIADHMVVNINPNSTLFHGKQHSDMSSNIVTQDLPTFTHDYAF